MSVRSRRQPLTSTKFLRANRGEDHPNASGPKWPARWKAPGGEGGVGREEALGTKVTRRVRRPLRHPSLALRMVLLPRFAGAEEIESRSRGALRPSLATNATKV